jgi:hypothetical protein
VDFWVKIDPKSLRDIRKLKRALRDPAKQVKRLGRGLSRAAAESMLETVREGFRSAGHKDMAEAVNLVQFRDGSGVGIGVFPRQDKACLSDLRPEDAVYVFSRGHESDEGIVCSALSKHNPWYGPLLPFLPHRGEAVTVIRRVRGDESQRLKQISTKALPGVIEVMRERGVEAVHERKEMVWVDVGFFGQRLEFGLDGSEIQGMWRRALMDVDDLPYSVAGAIEGLLFANRSWSLTSAEDARTMESSEETIIVEFQRNIKGR